MQNEWWIEKAHEIQSFVNKNDMHNFYNAIKTIYGPTNHCITSLKTADGLTLLKDQNTILVRWAEHFNILLNRDSDADPTILEELPKLPPIHNLSLPPTFQEVLSSVRSLKNNKSPGTDNIPAELLKEGGTYVCAPSTGTSPRPGLMRTSHSNGKMQILLLSIRTRATRPSAAIVGAYHSFLWVVRSCPR